jgi:molybdenum cofactor biosynthesis enzyme MoaA
MNLREFRSEEGFYCIIQAMKSPPFPHKICSKPFDYLEVAVPRDGRVDCYACCPTILPNKVGDLAQQNLMQVWNSEMYQDIRRSIIDGSYKYCRHDLCPEIQSETLSSWGVVESPGVIQVLKTGEFKIETAPRIINLSYDNVCNLSCPSCRTGLISTNSPEDDKIISGITDELLSGDLSGTTLIACSSGDPFVSEHFRRLLFGLDGAQHPGMKVQIMTNGLMFTRQAWEKMAKIHRNISMVCVSIDAAREETYKITRRGGHFATLIKNIEFLSGLRLRNEIPFLRLDFVVQDHNFREMEEFVLLGKKLGVDQVFFQKIANWGTFPEKEYQARAVYLPGHPDEREFSEMMNSKLLRDPIVNPGNLGDRIGKFRRPFNFKKALLNRLRTPWRYFFWSKLR